VSDACGNAAPQTGLGIDGIPENLKQFEDALRWNQLIVALSADLPVAANKSESAFDKQSYDIYTATTTVSADFEDLWNTSSTFASSCQP